MKKTVISVTEAARNFVNCINRVHYQNVSYLLLKNGSPLARLVPADEKTCTGRDPVSYTHLDVYKRQV